MKIEKGNMIVVYWKTEHDEMRASPTYQVVGVSRGGATLRGPRGGRASLDRTGRDQQLTFRTSSRVEVVEAVERIA